ncbi:DUF2058 family protein [Lysobacter sp. S4-A87]|uniref:DUF2058 domain-containing protein n=1 Tax=Lysobacter sp. S4-A87 TaxID=2925843 RepID=UPI001F53474D|nr:DUF2058 family protein [Lysobacter sp. S4-A87]UNK50067.1 DUF2058 family protein [Lysobacter sp. S4-A87]
MSNSLRDELMGLGFKPAPKPEPKPKPERPAQPRQDGRPGARPAGKHGARGPAPGAGPHGGKPGGHAAGAHKGDPRKGDPRRGDPRRGDPRQGDPRKPGGPRPGGKPQSREDIDLAKAYAIRAQREKDERIAAEAAKQEEARQRREARAKLAELVKDKALNDPAAEIARHFPYGGKIKRIYVNETQLKALNAGELGVLQMDGRYVLVSAEMLAQAEQIFAAAIALKVDPDAPAGEDPYADPQYQVPDDLVW